MLRRHLIVAAASGGIAPFVTPASAHHGWSSFDTARPIYLEGRAAAVRWRNPHAEIDLDVRPDLKLPQDLANRPVPAQAATVDGPALLAKAVLPTRKDKRWTIELAPLTRMDAWRVAPLQPGASVAVLGYTTAGEQGDAVLRVEYLFVDQQAYGLRSMPA